MNLDLRDASYQDFLTFVFDHYPEDDVDKKWYFQLDGDVQVDPRRTIQYLAQLCSHASELRERFTLPQITEGLSYLFGEGKFEFADQLWNPEVPWPDRRRCILAIPQIYAQVLEQDPDGGGGCGYMLWDWIAYDYYCGNRDSAKNAEDARVQDTMFEALTSMLASDHPETQAGAIHGLGHLCHRDSSDAIRKFLSANRTIDSKVRAYAGQVLEGNFQ